MAVEEDSQDAPVVEKKSRGKLIGILLAAVLVIGAAAGGAIFGGKLLVKPEAPTPEPAAAPKDPPIGETAAMPPIVVDVRDEQGGVHHIKVALSFELADGVREDELKRYMPRGRSVAIAYLRAESFETVTDPKQFKKVSQELTTRTSEAMGKERVRRALVTDFVAQ